MKTQKILMASVVGVLAVSCAWAQQTLVADQSEIKFTAKQLGVSVSGHFKKFDADINLNPKDLATSSVKLSVDVGSATMNNAEADANLPQPVWFNVAQFPKATFESSSIRQLETDQYLATGTLTVKGVATDLIVPVRLTHSNGTTSAVGKFPIERLIYKIGDNEWSDTTVIANEVQVDFKLTINGLDPV